MLFGLLGAANFAQAGTLSCGTDFGGVIDGFNQTTYNRITSDNNLTLAIDTSCLIKNWPVDNGIKGFPGTNINFYFPGGADYYIVFDNVHYEGNMSCNNPQNSNFWIYWAPGSFNKINPKCQEFMVPVEMVVKNNPAGETTARIGVPFTYTITAPKLGAWSIDKQGNGTFKEISSSSDAEIRNLVIVDDLDATGAKLTYLTNQAYLVNASTGARVLLNGGAALNTGVSAAWLSAHPGVSADALFFSYENNNDLQSVPAGYRVDIELTVVLDNDPAINYAGRQFANTVDMWFDKIIKFTRSDGTTGTTAMTDLHAWPGTTLPLTIVEPDLVVDKSSTVTNLNLGGKAPFEIDAQNVGGAAAWNVTITDILPDGMCTILADPPLRVGIYDADGALVSELPGSAYEATYADCQLVLTLLDAAGAIEPTQHLIINYTAQLDLDVTSGSVTNVAGATRWFNADSSIATRQRSDRTLTDGTPDVTDFQDAYTINVAAAGYYFLKSVENLTAGISPATSALPGDRLRYTLQIQNFTLPTLEVSEITDTLDAAFEPGSLAVHEAGTDLPVTPVVSGNSLSIPAFDLDKDQQYQIQFDAILQSPLAAGTVVPNQAFISGTYPYGTETRTLTDAPSDDPNIDGPAQLLDEDGEPTMAGDPTNVTIVAPGALAKANPNGKTTATIGEQFKYTVTVPATPVDVPLYDVRILDKLGDSGADLRFIRAEVVSGGTWALSNTGPSDTDLILEDTATGVDIPAGGQVVIEITVELQNTQTNQAGLSFKNTAYYTYSRTNGSTEPQLTGGADSTDPMTVVEPAVTSATKTVRFVSPAGKPATEPATVGDVLEYTVTVPNSGTSTAFDVSVVDTLPADLALVPDSATAAIGGVAVAGFVATPTTLPDGSLAWGRDNDDESLDIPAGQTLVLTYQATVVSVTGEPIVNGVHIDWTSLQDGQAGERTGDGCPAFTEPDDYCYVPEPAAVGTIDNTTIAKAVYADSYAEDPASTGDPVVRVGDTVTYDLTLSLQEYTTRSVVVTDVLPAGMVLESFEIIAGANFSYTLSEQPAAGATGTLKWDFGDIVNAPSNDNTPVDPLVIRYVARVITDPPPTGVDYATSILRENTAQLSYTGGDPAVYPDRLTAAETIEVRQPQMSAITKVDLGSGRVGDGTESNPYEVNIATDVMSFRLSSCNGGLAPAYGVMITDDLAWELDEAALATAPLVKIGTTTLTAGVHYTYTAPARDGVMSIALKEDVAVHPNECVTVDYDIGFHTDLTSQRKWNNWAQLQYASLPTDGRVYPSSEAKVWMTNAVGVRSLSKTLESPAEATIGEEVVYKITVPALPANMALENVVVTDVLHGAFEYVGATATLNGSPRALTVSQTGQELSLGLGTLAAGEQVVITLTARVANNDQANAGTVVANAASYTYTGMTDGSLTSSTSGALTIIEPLVTVTKSVPATSPQAGDLLTYTVSLAAAGGTAGDVYAHAFELTIVDSLGLGLVYEAGSATLNGTALANPSVAGDGVTAAQTLTWDPSLVDIDLAEGTTATVTYQVRVLGSVVPGQSLTNSVVARWTGLDGDQSAVNERTGSGTPAVNDYFTQPATTTLMVPLAVAVTKSVVNQTTGQNPGANASPGDTLHYTLVLTNESVVPVTNGALVDTLASYFAPGSLQILSVSDPGADSSNSNATGGANGTGIVDIRSLTLAAQGEPGATVTIEFQATLAAVIPDGTNVLNQAQLTADSLPAAPSNETSTLIASAPQLVVQKVSQDVTGDPDVLAAGDTLRYTITVRNTGDENATGVSLSDMIPVHTTYVAGTTRLNGGLVADPGAGVSALQAGLAVNAPGDASGLMRADASGNTVATVTFDVVVNASVVEGTLIANQGFVNGAGEGSGPFVERPSDDPATPVPDDPTIDIVGNLPLVDAHKVVAIVDDQNGNGAADPGDTLRYTIVVSNFGAVPATGVVLTDDVPQYTTYVADSVILNGAGVGRPDGGVSPLIAGVALNSAGQPSGTIAAGASATIVFDVEVNAGVAAGTVISNQGYVATTGLATEPTDADGIDTNGDQPTTIVVGSAQRLFITKEVFVIGGGVAQAGSQLEYVVRVTNTGAAPATRVVLTDDLATLAGLATYVANSATLNGSAAGVSYVGTVLTANYAGELAAGATATLRFRVLVASSVAVGTTLTNTAQVAWNTPTLTAQASVSLAIGGLPGSAALNGTVWHDVDFDNLHDSGEASLSGWTVALWRNGAQLGSVTTDAAGTYRFSGLAPTVTTADQYELRFSAPGATATTAKLGLADSVFTNGMQQISGIAAASGSNLQGLNLPIDPNGVVFDSITRVPVGGATLVLTPAGSTVALPASCFDDPAQQGQVTLASGFYKFDVNYSDAACPVGGDYVIRVTPPGTGYNAGLSQVIPPVSHDGTAPYAVASCPADAVTTTADYCEAQATAYAPGLAVLPAQVHHYLHLTLSNPVPNDSQLFNNHIPVDRVLQNALTISKTAGVVNVSRGQLVPYTITVNNTLGVNLTDMRIVDTFPPGFKYVEGSARVNGVKAEPVFTNRNLTWNSLNVVEGTPLVIKLLFIVGSGVGEGEYVNRAQVFHSVLGAASGEATATVRVVPDPTFDCTDIIGKVFDDGNRNGYQDEGEKGLPGVRVATARGLLVTTDPHGRFHISCAVVADEDRGSNFILKVDDRTLPTGYRTTTENPRVQRVTRGKMAKFNFGATIHKVVRIDVANGVFAPGTTEMRIQWKPRMDLLMGELKKGPSTLRLAYMAEIEDEKLVETRLKTMKQVIERQWALHKGPYELVIETEVFWRTGAPPSRSALK